MCYLNTRKNTIFLHVKISIISLTSGLSLKLYLNSLVYHRNIFASSSKMLGNLRKSSDIFGNSRKMFGNVRLVFGQFEKSSEIFGRWSEIFAALTREILFLPLEHKIHIFSTPCNILYISIPRFAVPDGFRRVKFSQEYFRKFFVTWLNKKLLHYCCGT